MDLENIINNAWTNRELLKDSNTIIAIEKVIEMLDIGELRVCDKDNRCIEYYNIISNLDYFI